MDKFTVPPDDCLILKAFRDASTLREAARLLGCDPAGLTRRVQNISSEFGLINKVNNRWQLTSRGLDLVVWTEASIQSQKKVFATNNHLRIASTMWFSEEVLLPQVAGLRELFLSNGAAEMGFHFSVPDKGFEMALIDGSVDFVVVCHPPENPEIAHRQVIDESWSLIAPARWRRELAGRSLTDLKQKPFIRHSAMNTDLFVLDLAGEVVESGLAFDNLIGVRAAVREGLGWSIVPTLLIARDVRENRIMEVPHENFVRDRRVCLWWLRNRSDSRKMAAKMSTWIRDACL